MLLLRSHIRGWCLAGLLLAGTTAPLLAQSLAQADTAPAGVVDTTDDSSFGPVAPGAPNSAAVPSQDTSAATATPSTTSTGPSFEGSADYTGGSSAGPITGPGATSTGAFSGFFGGTSKVPFHLTANLGESYDDNIFIQRNKVSDYITTLSVKGELRLGTRSGADTNYFDLYYDPTGLLYVKHSREDSLDHNVGAFYQHRFSRLTLSLEQTYAHVQSSNAAIGNLVTSNVFNTVGSASYDYSDKLAFRASGSQNFTDFVNSNYTSTREWTGDLYFLYRIDDRLSLGVGPRFGFVDIQRAPNQTYQQLLAHLTYAYSEKLTLTAAGGAEYREYQGGVPGNSLAPVFELAGHYRPTEFMDIALTGSRHEVPSYNFIGEDYYSSNVAFSVTQAFYRKFSASVAAGYENDDYKFAASGFSGASREDNYFFASPSVTWHPNDLLTVNLYYRYQRDDSSFHAYDFNDNQVGISLSATY